VQAEPLITWSEPLVHLAEFAAALLPAGAVGFRYSSLRGHHPETDRRVYSDAAQRAAWIGLIGSLVGVFLLTQSLPALADRRHTTVGALLTGTLQPAVQVAMLALALAGFALATRRIDVGWHLAVVGVLVGQLRAILGGDLLRVVNPAHVLAAGLWIGTLFVLAVAGISIVLRDEPARERRGAIVADMVHRFSPLALTSAACLVLLGVITAWRHLHRLSALWTTPYGYALIVKLGFVSIVAALGAWNWRRQRPRLGAEETAVAIRRSAGFELTAAGIVLLVTSVLVSLPSPPR
jgi:putative copper export protein